MTGRGAPAHRLRTGRGHVVAEPLPLQMPAPSPLPGNLRPEAPVPCVEPFDDPEWRFSVDWDGCRALLFAAQDGRVRLQGEALADLTNRYPELLLAGRSLQRLPAVLDGVVAVLDPQGRPDLPALARRVLPGSASWRRRPAVFLATDLLYLGDSSTLGWPLDRRLAALRSLVGDGVGIQAPDSVDGRGTALAEAAAQRGLTALLARRGAGVYHCGIASRDRLRMLLENRSTCVLAGFQHGRDPSGTLLLAEYESGRLLPAGTVPGPADPAMRGWLRRRVAALRVDDPQTDDGPYDGVTWLRLQLTVTVDHAGRTSQGTLRGAELVAVRDDVDPRWCMRRDPVLPPSSSQTSMRFVPTVLEPLPLEAGALLPAT